MLASWHNQLHSACSIQRYWLGHSHPVTLRPMYNQSKGPYLEHAGARWHMGMVASSLPSDGYKRGTAQAPPELEEPPTHTSHYGCLWPLAHGQ